MRPIPRDQVDPDCSEFKPIDTNSYGAILKAYHSGHNKVVAVKLVRCMSCDGVSTNRYTSDEGGQPKDFTILRSIKHPHVLEILSLYRGGPRELTNIISEYQPGGTLLDYVHQEHQIQRTAPWDWDRRGIPELVCRDIMYQLAQGMAHIHNQGIVHRNLKLENILLTADANPFIKIAGLGLAARLPSNGESLTEVIGSIDYMAPEMLRYPPIGYDCRADSWSAGVILIEMLLLENAYMERRTFPEFILPAIRWGPLLSRLSDDGAEFLEMLLAPDPFMRFMLVHALQHRWLMYHRPMHPNVVYPELK
ncbi:kinase-like domain-containing protein [Mycena polygramma]|nr:kinase-like domain-containing protein [Mycena polygramma]